MNEDSEEAGKIRHANKKLNISVLRLLARQALLEAFHAAGAAGSDVFETVRLAVLDEKLAATVYVQFPDDASVFFEEIERMLMMIAGEQEESSSGDVQGTQS